MTNPYCLLMTAKKLEEIKDSPRSKTLSHNKDNLKTTRRTTCQPNKTTTKVKKLF